MFLVPFVASVLEVEVGFWYGIKLGIVSLWCFFDIDESAVEPSKGTIEKVIPWLIF